MIGLRDQNYFHYILQVKKLRLAEVNALPKFTQLVRKLNYDVNSVLFDPTVHTPYIEEFDK